MLRAMQKNPQNNRHRNMKILLKKALLFLFSILIITFLVGYYWLVNDWKNYIEIEDMEEVASKIKNMKPLDSELISIYYKVYPNHKNITVSQEIFNKIISAIKGKYHNSRLTRNCFCDDVFNQDWTLNEKIKKRNFKRDPLKQIKLGIGLLKYVSPEECLNYSIRMSYEEIKKYPDYRFYLKEFNDLNGEDFVDFLIAEKAPTLFSPIRSPDKYEARKKLFEQYLVEESKD